nr:ankyrin repeat family protein [Tanacetum cinerariifolium]
QRRDESQSTTYEHGLRVGFKGNYVGSKEDKYFINNHLSFRVMYHKDLETDSARIIGFEVTPNRWGKRYKHGRVKPNKAHYFTLLLSDYGPEPKAQARYALEDFLYKLPKRLIFGLVMLFLSVTSMMIAFSAALYIMFGQEKQWILIPIGALACLPIALFVTLQFPLLDELISSTYGHGMFGKEKDYRQSSANANKKKRT